ncbi:hypothetical protein Zmor_017488 [Zophobas morio]|uniref:Uncharacterized protein n=1 Tax=Zophobas morio TaxID=2755281 RepID=A0AA38I934_9CUCU|nr:hypothetical protein Zmor_017488 [Zophobas morio]
MQIFAVIPICRKRRKGRHPPRGTEFLPPPRRSTPHIYFATPPKFPQTRPTSHGATPFQGHAGRIGARSRAFKVNVGSVRCSRVWVLVRQWSLGFSCIRSSK